MAILGPVPVPTEKLPGEGLAATSFHFPFLRQNTSATSARKATPEEPKTMPTIGPALSPFCPFPVLFGFVGCLLEPWGGWGVLCLPGGGGVYGGGGGAGPLANEFPSDLFHAES